jgi:hypothetical protein
MAPSPTTCSIGCSFASKARPRNSRTSAPEKFARPLVFGASA